MENPDTSKLTSHYQNVLGNYSNDVVLNVERIDRYGESFAEVSMTYSYTINIPLLDNYPLQSSYKNLIIISDEAAG